MINILQPKEGGTIVGNIFRGIAGHFSDGQLGQGQMKIKPGESPENYQKRLQKALGSALSGWQSTINTKAYTDDPLKEGYVIQLLKNYSPYLLILPIPIYLIWKIKHR